MARVSAAVAEQGVVMDVVLDLTRGCSFPRIATLKIGRKKTPILVPTYCPFCGVKYAE
jgi:hypothetical protein